MSQVIEEIVAERQRQIEVEGWTSAHDDQHTAGELALAAAATAMVTTAGDVADPDWITHQARSVWPFDGRHWKPKGDRRRNLVRAAALTVAEIDRLDRAQKNSDPAKVGQGTDA